MNQSDLIQIREIQKEDGPFIYATWLRQLWYSRENLTTLTKETFFKIHHDRISKALVVKKSLVACLKEDPDIIIGYVVDVTPVWVYVKKDWRDIGIAEMLREQL